MPLRCRYDNVESLNCGIERVNVEMSSNLAGEVLIKED